MRNLGDLLCLRSMLMSNGERRTRPRGLRTYEKPALGHRDLVRRMEDRGLAIPDPDRAERYLRHVGYYRLSPYMIPLQVPGGTHQFDPGTRFDDVLALYVFDRQLRILVLDAVERLEVAVRAAITDTMALRFGPHWYTDASHLQRADEHRKLLGDQRDTNKQQLERLPETEHSRFVYPSALEHYLTQYAEPELPPSWIFVEGLTLGALTRMYGNLFDGADRQSIALSVGTNEALLASWLRTYVRVRNICAHHGRLWNVGLGVYPKLPRSRAINWPRDAGAVPDRDQKRLYPVLVSLQSILHTISPGSSWSVRLRALLESYPGVPFRAMGIPENWFDDPFWPA